MKRQVLTLDAAVAKEYVDAQVALAALPRVLSERLAEERSNLEDAIGSPLSRRRRCQTMFQDFDQKANQLFNLLSTFTKNMQETSRGITRNVF